jgi:hypothetical protein
MGYDQGGRSSIAEGRVGANIMQDGSVEMHYGTRVDSYLHPCIKRHNFKQGYFAFEDPQIKSLYCMDVHLFLGLLAWLLTCSMYKIYDKKRMLCFCGRAKGS